MFRATRSYHSPCCIGTPIFVVWRMCVYLRSVLPSISYFAIQSFKKEHPHASVPTLPSKFVYFSTNFLSILRCSYFNFLQITDQTHEVLEERRKGLNDWICAVASNPLLNQSNELIRFLTESEASTDEPVGFFQRYARPLLDNSALATAERIITTAFPVAKTSQEKPIFNSG